MRNRSRLAGLGVLALASIAAGSALAADAPPLPSDELFTNPTRASHRFDDFTYPAAERRAEAGEKLARLRKELAARKLDGVVISTERNLNWISAGGKDTVVVAQRETPVKLLITADRLYLIANNIEGPRVMTEELGGLGYEWKSYGWTEAESGVLDPLIRKKKIAFDDPNVAASYTRDPTKAVFDFQAVYYPITAGELKKYRWLGRKTSEVLELLAQVIRPGMTEKDLQYLVNREFGYWDIFPTVVLTAVDERFRTYRHPVVMGDRLKNYAALNVCVRKWGLVISTTRLVYFGSPDPQLAKAFQDGAKVQAAMWAASKPGKSLGDVIDAARKAYGDVGFPDEWKLHHQGGMILGLERLYTAAPGDRTRIIPGMVLAWNPTIQGAKFEETVVVNADGTLENLSAPIKWPTEQVKVGDTTYRIPTLLVRPVP